VKRREQAAWRRERLLDAALDVFVSEGIDRATVKDIAQAAGVTPGLLYHYFDGKDTLLATLLEERSFLSKLRRQLAGATDRPATVVLPEMVRAYRQVLAENRGLVSLFFSASSTNRHVRTRWASSWPRGSVC
jgi:AcrR family transcriptional regulator